MSATVTELRASRRRPSPAAGDQPSRSAARRSTRIEAATRAQRVQSRHRRARARAGRRHRPAPRGGESLGPLAGVPVALKDNLCVRGMRTTASSRILDTFVPPYNATVVERLESAGAVIVGKTNCDEFAMGSSNENSAYGPVRNPWALDRTPGGSSGGSAAAVAARCVPLALGSDTGGSIRQPASFCGVVGLKPTYGRVSRYGLLAFASSLDQIGPFTRTVQRRGARALGDRRRGSARRHVIRRTGARLSRGADRRRPRRAHRCTARLCDRWRRRRRRAAFFAALEVLRECRSHARGRRSAARPLRDSGLLPGLHGRGELEPRPLRRREVRLPRGLGPDTPLTRCTAPTRDEGFGAEVKRRIMLGTYVLSAGYYDAFYLKAQQVRTLLRRDYEHAFEQVDVVAMPTSPIPPFKLGEKTDDPLQMYLADIFTVSVNLAGLPGISVPCGFADVAGPTGRPADRPSVDWPDVRRSDDAARGRRLRAPDAVARDGAPAVDCGRSERIRSEENAMMDRRECAAPAGRAIGGGRTSAARRRPRAASPQAATARLRAAPRRPIPRASSPASSRSRCRPAAPISTA